MKPQNGYQFIMRVDKLFVILDAMRYELVIRDKNNPEKEWIIRK